MRSCVRKPLSRHRPPPGLAFGEPDDRLRRAIGYSETPMMESISRSVLDTPRSRSMTTSRGRAKQSGPAFCAAMDCFAELPRHPNSAPFHAASTPVSNVNRGLVGSAGAALHVIDEGSQLRHYLPVAGIIEKQANRQQFRQFMHLHRFEGWLG